jgi:hypothetical protein
MAARGRPGGHGQRPRRAGFGGRLSSPAAGRGADAWPAPKILDWKSFVRAAWEERAADARLVLNPRRSRRSGWALRARKARWRRCWRGRGSAWRRWRWRRMSCFARMRRNLCRRRHEVLGSRMRGPSAAGWRPLTKPAAPGNLLSASRLPLELIPLLQASGRKILRRPTLAACTAASPLLLAGFDRILPAQRSFFDAWGEWREAAQGEPAGEVHFYEAATQSGGASGLRALVRKASLPRSLMRGCWWWRNRPARGGARSSAPFYDTRRGLRVFAGSSAQAGCAGAGGAAHAALAGWLAGRAGA